MAKENPRVLLVKLSSLGDVLQASFIPSSIKQSLPNARIDWLVSSDCETIVKGNPFVNFVLSVPFQKWKFFLFIRLFFLLLWNRYDVVLIAHRSPLFSYLFYVLHVPIRVGFTDSRPNLWLTDSVPFDLKFSFPQLHRRLVSSAFPDASFLPFVDLVYSSLRAPSYSLPNTPFIVVAPGGGKNRVSSMEAKRFSDYDRFISLFLAKFPQYSVVILGDAFDSAFISSFDCLNLAQVFDFSGKLSVSEGAFVLSLAKGFVGNDSMLLYLALSQKLPSLGVFGPTSGQFFLEGLSYAFFVQSQFSCSPCYTPLLGASSLAFSCPYEYACTHKELRAEMVLEVFSKVVLV